MRQIEELLDKYFEGETSSAEEKELRKFFSSGDVPEHLMVHKPLFAYFDEEIKKEEATIIKKRMPERRKVLLWVSGVAAAVLLLLGIGQLYIFPGKTFCSENYVVINGRCYTDPHTIREHALNALQEITTNERDLFPLMEEDEDRQVIEDQFRALGSFFTDDDE